MNDPRNDADMTTGRPVVPLDAPDPKSEAAEPSPPLQSEDILRDTAVQGGDESRQD